MNYGGGEDSRFRFSRAKVTALAVVLIHWYAHPRRNSDCYMITSDAQSVCHVGTPFDSTVVRNYVGPTCRFDLKLCARDWSVRRR